MENTKYYLPKALRVEALRATAKVIEPTTGSFGNLISGVQTVYEWLRTGKMPVEDNQDDSED